MSHAARCDVRPRTHRFPIALVLTLALVAFAASTGASVVDASEPVTSDPVTSESAIEPLMFPFGSGQEWVITADQHYVDGSDHGSLFGEVAFDMDINSDEDPPILAVGTGQARIVCAATMAIVELDVVDHGVFTYVHLDADSVLERLTTEWSDVSQGDELGHLFMPTGARYVEDWDCGPQFVYGAHLHLEFPNSSAVIEGVTFDEHGPNRGSVLQRPCVEPEIDADTQEPVSPVVALLGGFSPLDGTPIDGYSHDTGTAEHGGCEPYCDVAESEFLQLFNAASDRICHE